MNNEKKKYDNYINNVNEITSVFNHSINALSNNLGFFFFKMIYASQNS